MRFLGRAPAGSTPAGGEAGRGGAREWLAPTGGEASSLLHGVRAGRRRLCTDRDRVLEVGGRDPGSREAGQADTQGVGSSPGTAGTSGPLEGGAGRAGGGVWAGGRPAGPGRLAGAGLRVTMAARTQRRRCS